MTVVFLTLAVLAQGGGGTFVIAIVPGMHAGLSPVRHLPMLYQQSIWGGTLCLRVLLCHNTGGLLQVELHIESMFLVSAAPPQLPFVLDDASRKDMTAEEVKAAAAEGALTITVSQDARLNARLCLLLEV